MTSLLFGNGTDIVHWQPSCDPRGIFDILSTCIITTLLCAWTAVHLNVPAPGSDWESRLRKIGWLILALLAPEIVAYTANLRFVSRTAGKPPSSSRKLASQLPTRARTQNLKASWCGNRREGSRLRALA